MAKEIDKIIQSKTAPKSNNVLWDDGENLKINRNGNWENTNTTEIKEGSIPLSALANDVKYEFNGKYGLNGYCGSLGINNKTVDTNIYFRSAVYIQHGNKIASVYIGTYTIHELFSGAPPIEGKIVVYDKNEKLSLDIRDNAGYWNDLKVFKELREVPNSDWNAYEGETGYIENKPFGLYDKCEFTLGNGVNKAVLSSHAMFMYFKDNIIELPEFKDGIEVSINNGPPVSVKYGYTYDGKPFLELIDPANYFSETTVEFYRYIKLIKSSYIPDTIARTEDVTALEDRIAALEAKLNS